VSLAAISTIYTVLEPFLTKDKLEERMKSVGGYRDNLRQQQREAFAKKASPRLRNKSPQGALKQVVENLKLLEVFDSASASKKLMMAGYRGQGPVFIFMGARLGLPFVVALGVGVYVYVFGGGELDNFGKLLATFGGFFAGFYLPNIYIGNAVKARQQTIQLAWPDALDLLLICVESGMSIEAAFQKVGDEIGGECSELSEELGLTTAELSYLQERKQAYVNLAERTGLNPVGEIRNAAGPVSARDGRGKPHFTHAGSRNESGGPAAETDRSDDWFFPAGAVRGDFGAGDHVGHES